MIKAIKYSPTIIENQQGYIDCLTATALRIKRVFNTHDTTKVYPFYNIFNATSSNMLMYKLFNELKTVVRDELGYEQPLWMQAWLNFQDDKNLLKWHDHDWDWHGYICIDPKNTKTIWREFEIENKIGQIYFGDGHKEHAVEAVEPFDGYRITLGFDITNVPDVISTNFGLLPF